MEKPKIGKTLNQSPRTGLGAVRGGASDLRGARKITSKSKKKTVQKKNGGGAGKLKALRETQKRPSKEARKWAGKKKKFYGHQDLEECDHPVVIQNVPPQD